MVHRVLGFTSFSLVACVALIVFPCASIASPLPINAGANTPLRGAVLGQPVESEANRRFREGVQATLENDFERAIGLFRAAIDVDPGFAPGYIGLADIAQRRGNRTEAERLLTEARLRAPKSPEVALAWGRLHLSERRFSEAEKAFLEARSAAPQSVAPLLELGDLYMLRSDRHRDALEAFQAALSLDENNAIAIFSTGVAAAALGNTSMARVYLERAAELSPTDALPLQVLGRMYLEAGRVGEGLAAFERGLTRQPEFLPLMLDRSNALARLGRVDEAIEQAKALERIMPDSPALHLALGDLYQQLQRWDDAHKHYERVIGMEPSNPVAYNNLAWMKVATGSNVVEAVALARRAIELSPDSAVFHDTYGWALRAASDLPGAQRSLERAVQLEPNVALYHFHHGVVTYELGLRQTALASFERALDLDPKFEHASEARRLADLSTP